jgi:hypothetical protein
MLYARAKQILADLDEVEANLLADASVPTGKCLRPYLVRSSIHASAARQQTSDHDFSLTRWWTELDRTHSR